MEGAPNNQDGGSSLVAPMMHASPERLPPRKIQCLRSLQANLAKYVAEEMAHVDVTNPEQGCYMEALTTAILNKSEVEEITTMTRR